MDEKQICLVALEEDVVCAQYAFYDYDPMERSAQFGRFMVAPSRQEKGIGRRLLRNAMNRIATEKLLSKVWLVVRVENKRALRLYEDTGFAKRFDERFSKENLVYMEYIV